MKQDSLLSRLDELIQIGEAVVGTRRPPPPRVLRAPSVDSEKFGKWRISSMTLLRSAFKESSIYFTEFAKECKVASHPDAVKGLAILRAVKSDVLSGIGVETSPAVGIEGLPLHPRISEVCIDLYRDGHFSSAVLEASKALINYVKEKSRRDDLDGADLMRTVFSPKKPILFSEVIDESEQEGMMHLFEGAVLAIRNPRGHDFPDDSPERALEYISFISLLTNLVQEAHRTDSSG